MLFHRKPQRDPQFPPERFEPVIRSSICTGERTACMRDRETGKIHEIMLLRTPRDLEEFAKQYGADPDAMQTIY